VELVEAVVGAVGTHPAVAEIELVGSRAEGRATERSDWDFAVCTSNFGGLESDLAGLVEPLEPLVRQWDRLSDTQCYMLLLRGPVKVDLIFPDEPHAHEPPWQPEAGTLRGIDDHLWDWLLWLSSKAASGKRELVRAELEKLHDHLLAPLGVKAAPATIGEAVSVYRPARARAERRFAVEVPREVEDAVLPALASG
jgi:Nucleotidyltransferase domain